MTEKYLIQIGESVHASIPKSGTAMRELIAAGPEAYTASSESLDYIISLITSQVAGGADYIAVNVDDLGHDHPDIVVDQMRTYVNLVRQHSNGVPVCIDSSNDDLLIAGLEEWYKDAPDDIVSPLVNSVKTVTTDNILPLREKYAFKIVGMLVDEEAGDSSDVENLYKLARTIFDAATAVGIAPDEMFFDTTAYPIAIDMPMMPDTPGYTYRCFNAIKRIKQDPDMQNVHFILGLSNSVRNLPGRKIGVNRAYTQIAREYGLDAGIVNINHQYGSKPADPELLELVQAFADQDGSADATNNAMMLMAQFCQNHRK